eukprot:15127-Chlamydomonas_euryale.AAC.8
MGRGLPGGGLLALREATALPKPMPQPSSQGPARVTTVVLAISQNWPSHIRWRWRLQGTGSQQTDRSAL